MANFGKFANLSPTGWSAGTGIQVIAIGHNAHIGLWGGGPAGEDLDEWQSFCGVRRSQENR
jgi:hypothetical protein